MIRNACKILAFPLIKQDLAFFVQKWQTTVTETQPLSKWQSRAQYFLQKGSNWWEGLSKAPENSFKNRIFKAGNYFLDRIDADEWFLKDITHTTRSATLVFPDTLQKEVLEHRLKAMLLHRTEYHKKMRFYSILCLPLSFLMGIIPGPNVFLAYNVFRIYSHEKARQGSERLFELWESQQIHYEPSSKLSEILNYPKDCVLENMISKESLEKIQKEFEMPSIFMHQAERAMLQFEKKHLSSTNEGGKED